MQTYEYAPRSIRPMQTNKYAIRPISPNADL